jgi:small conductance mechanosensitive channel
MMARIDPSSPPPPVLLPGLLLLVAAAFFTPALKGQAAKEAAPTPDQRVEVSATTPDQGIRQRILDVFSQVDEFKLIEVKVTSGVVTLTGEVPAARTREDALALVRRTEGVVLALDRLTETAEVAARLSPAMAKLDSLGRNLVAKLPLIAIAVVVLILFVIIANFLHRRERWFSRLRVSSLARNLARRLVRLVVIAIGFIIALEILNATAIVGAVFGAAGLVGIALGFAFKNILENYLSGILLSTRNPFDIGDVIEVGGKSGKVALLTSRDTVMVTPDGNHLRIPNSIVINSELLNFTRNPLRRFEFVAGISVDIDLNEARKVGLDALAQNPAVLQDPEPSILIDALGESTIDLKFYAWLDQTKHDTLKVRSQSIRLVKEAFDEAGIEMPEPIYRVHIHQPGVKEAAGKNVSSSAPATISAKEEDLSADRTIDKQVRKEQQQSQEKNLLPDSPDLTAPSQNHSD